MNPDLAAAADRARLALQQGASNAAHHATIGWAALANGDDHAAHAAFHAALRITARHPEALVGLANILRRQGQLRDAVLHCDAALAEAPDLLDAWLERGFVLSSGGSMAAASDCYRRVLALDPDHAAAHAGLAAILARDGEASSARDHAQRAIASDPDNAIATAALASLELEAGQPSAARDLLAPLVARTLGPSAERLMLANLLGDALAKLAEPDAAYDAYALSNGDFAAIHADRYASPTPARDFVERIAAETAAAPHAVTTGPSRQPPNAADRHLVLLGFPRSGTTMVENILASIPGVAALEEMPTLAEADRAFLAEPGGLARFEALGDAELAGYREAYWNNVARSGLTVAGQAFVDMDPLKGTRLPLIARLFPEARILVMRRDPRDVVWSCFHTSFALTNAALDFTSLEGVARHYAAMMRLIDLSHARFGLNLHAVRYEALVRDFAQETRKLCDFAGLPWSEDLLRFDRTARQRGVATASASQVRKGLYDGSGQWRPFARYFEPIMPILQPWIDAFGYEA